MLDNLFTEEEQETIRQRNMERKLSEVREKSKAEGIIIGERKTREAYTIEFLCYLKECHPEYSDDDIIHEAERLNSGYTFDELADIYRRNVLQKWRY